MRPFWSPDSRFVAFMAGGKLKKVDIAGGPPQTICDAPNGLRWHRGAPDGVILFDGRGNDPIWRVPAAGGVAQAEVAVRRGRAGSSARAGRSSCPTAGISSSCSAATTTQQS